jgi:hypothetical protein
VNLFVVPPVAAPSVPVYSHLPPHLAQALANLQPLNPPGQRGGRRQVTTSIAAPAAAPAAVQYQHLDPDLAQRVANLPPLNPPGHRGRRRHVTAPAAPAPLALNAALPVCFFDCSKVNFIVMPFFHAQIAAPPIAPLYQQHSNLHAAMEEVRRRDQRRIQQAQNGRGEVQLEEWTAQNAAQAPVRCIYSHKINFKLIFFSCLDCSCTGSFECSDCYGRGSEKRSEMDPTAAKLEK